MKKLLLIAITLSLAFAGCKERAEKGTVLQPKGFGAVLVEVSGGKQIAPIGTTLEQPLVIQVNDAKGSAVANAAVYLQGSLGSEFSPAAGLTDSTGQFTSQVSLGTVAGRYQLLAYSFDSAGKRTELKVEEIALGYQQTLGRQLDSSIASAVTIRNLRRSEFPILTT